MSERWDYSEIDEFYNDHKLYLILDALDEGIHIVDQDGRTIIYNKKASEIDGLEPEEVFGKNIFEVYPSLTIETSTLMRTLKSGKAINSSQQSFINSRGKKVTTINSTVPLVLGKGQIGAMEISRDITELQKLVESINDLRANLANSSQKKTYINNSKKICNNTTYSFKDIIGEEQSFKEVLKDAMRAAGSDSSVLLYGETGTGKELFAQSIHNASRRRDKPFIAQNCAALPKDLLEGLLFGTEKGGFTGAKSRPGLFEQADGGTILLDEVNSMDLALQAKLLRVLQENKVRRIGGQKEVDIDVRVIATMNMQPDKAFQQERLREDLFYRLSVVYLEIPPLRERKADLPLLTEHFIKLYNLKFDKNIKGIDHQLENTIYRYDWPGNIRELQHVIESAFNLLQNEELIRTSDLPVYLRDRINRTDQHCQEQKKMVGKELPPLDQTLAQLESDIIRESLKRTEGNVSAAARKLKVSRQSLQYKIKKYGL